MVEKKAYNDLVSKRLLHVLAEWSMSQKQLLEKLLINNIQISQSTISKIFSGDSLPILNVVQICEILGVEVSDVLSLDENKEIHVRKIKDAPTS